MKYPGSIKVKISHPKLADSYATALKIGKTPEDTVKKLNRMAAERGVEATYTLATDEEYLAYRNELRGAIAKAREGQCVSRV